MAKNLDDDEHVTELLKQETTNAKKRYELIGINAFNPRRADSAAPKPNKSFLRNIIRQTNRHNAALLTKEAEGSRARLRIMNRECNRGRTHDREERQRRADGRLTLVRGEDEISKEHANRRRYYSEDEDDYKKRPRSRERDSTKKSSSSRHQDRSRERRHPKKRYDREDDKDRSRSKHKRSRSPHDRSHRHRGSETEDNQRLRRRDCEDRRHRKHRSYSYTTSQSRSPPPHSNRHEQRRRHRRHFSRDIERSPERKHGNHEDRQSSKRRAASPASNSDPLEAIIGPLPPLPEPMVRSKGRGAFKPNSMGIESRFSSTYDPTIDVYAGSDDEDDWGDALEALRDRTRWRLQGAERLKSAGFTDEQVRKWERGEQQNEKDVVWKGKGEATELDRGKVMDGYGGVELKVDFGRLK